MQDESRPWMGDYGTGDERVGSCSWCGQTALCVVEEESDEVGDGAIRWRTCARCYAEPNPQEPVQHEALRLFTPVAVMRGQLGLG